MSADHVDGILAQWRNQRPDIDFSPAAVIGRISRASRAIDVLLRAKYAEFGLGEGEFDALATLRRAGPPFRLSPTSLGAHMMITSGAVSKRVDRLEALGLVRRIDSPTDGRSCEVELTTAGRALIDEAIAEHMANEERILAPLGAADRLELARLLRTLLIDLET